MADIFKIKKYRIITLCMMLFSFASFAQEYSDKTTGFDAARISVALKKRGLTDQNIQEEVALMRKLHNEQYAVMKKKENEQYTAIKKSEDAILQKITSEQALKTEANKTVTGLTAKTALTTADIPQTEKDALLALYNSTNGNNWTNKTGWNFSTPVTSGWYGITIVGGHVTGINLSNNNLTGTIPAAIGQLTELTMLHLFTNQLSGAIPAQIGQLTKIISLYLHQNQLTGIIPAEIGQLTKTTTLLLYANQLTGQIPAQIGQLTQLQYLSLTNNNLSGLIPAEIGQLTKLQSLLLNNNQLSGTIPASIGQLTKLQNLFLHFNQLSGSIPAEIGQLTDLTKLYLFNNQLTGGIPNQIGQLAKLLELWLYNNKLSGTIPTSIGQLTKLQQLHLYNNQLTGTIPAEIVQLTQLQQLYLFSNQLSGTIPPSIGLLTKLTSLQLYANQLTGIIPNEIGQLTKLTSLYLFSNQLSGVIPTSIGQLIQLQTLFLHNNQLNGTIPVEIKELINIQNINLSSNQLTGVIPAQIGLLTKLQYLYLFSNQLSGKIPTEIGQLTQLQHLYLHINQLIGTIPASIGQLTQLQNLYLNYNTLSGTIPVEIGQLTKLTRLYLYNNQLSGPIPASIGQLNQLTEIFFNNNKLNGTIPTSIGQLTKLTKLYLYNNQLSGTIPASIGQLIQLIEIYLYNNLLSGLIPAEIKQLTQLQNFYLYNNLLEGNIPDLTNVILGLNFHTNKFRFVDFASQFNAYKSKLTVFEYSNQAKTDSETTITKTAGETQTLTMYEDNRFTPADTYQWYKNGQVIAGATSRQYTLANLTLANSGDYYCISKNPQMTIASVANQNLILTRNTIHLNVSNCNAVLSSAVGTDKQNICFPNAITPITYTTSGLITGATFSGLPPGVTANFASNTVTISGAPTYEGSYSYIITYTGDCGTTLKSTGTFIALGKAVNPASAAPEICANTALTPITHTTRGGALTVGTPTGLPAGLTAVWGFNVSSTNAGTLIISGTPVAAGIYNYSIPLLGGCGDTINATGTITVKSPGAITLSSSPGTDNQSKNVNTAIAPVTYTTTTANGASISGLPVGVTGSFVSNTVTIAGTPTVSGTFNYAITLSDRCATTITGRITSLCEPITGIIKIINEPIPTVSYPFQFSNSNSTSSEACAQTAFPLELYVNTPTLGVGSILYWNDKLTTVYNGSNLWYQESAAGMSYRIGNTGQIAQASGCLKSFWYKADDVVLSPEPNYVIYLTEGGTQARFDLSREESGNPCEEIRAVKIIRFYRVSPCTSTGIAFRFSNSGTVQSAVCNQTSFPNTFYADTTTLSVKTVLYSDANLTTPITITGANAWYKNEENGTAYKVNSLGKIGLISYCGSSSSGTAYAYGVSSPGRDSSGLACSQTNFPNTFYAATSSLGIGSQMYNDSSLTSKMGGGDVWYKCHDPDVFYAFKLGNGGIITAIVTCGGN
jgi:Leucine-rich repeat (LRR) protein